MAAFARPFSVFPEPFWNNLEILIFFF